MNRAAAVLLAAAQLTCLLGLPGGCESRNAAAPPAPPPVSSSTPADPAAAVCMGAVGHPLHQIVQLGFLEKAEELGYEGHVLGLEEGLMQEQCACWLQGAREYDIAGAVCWVGDDSGYEFLKELHGMGVKTVVSHFAHSYADTKDFIDVNVRHDIGVSARQAAEFIGQTLRGRGVRTGSVGLTALGPGGISTLDLHAFILHMQHNYPEYTILEVRFEHMDPAKNQTAVTEYICENPDMVASFGTTGNSAQAWAAAKRAAGRDDIVAVGCDYTRSNLDLLEEGGVNALIAQPFYGGGARGMELIDALLCGKRYGASEPLWRQSLDAPLVYPGGAGAHDPAYYRGLHARAQSRFELEGGGEK